MIITAAGNQVALKLVPQWITNNKMQQKHRGILISPLPNGSPEISPELRLWGQSFLKCSTEPQSLQEPPVKRTKSMKTSYTYTRLLMSQSTFISYLAFTTFSVVKVVRGKNVGRYHHSYSSWPHRALNCTTNHFLPLRVKREEREWEREKRYNGRHLSSGVCKSHCTED